MIQFLQQVVPTANAEDWLKKQWLIQQGKLTVAGFCYSLMNLKQFYLNSVV